MQLALISALMVTHNRPKLAACSIECFRRQTWIDRELVIVDDGSDDTLAQHVQTLSDPRIRMVRLPCEGLPLGTLRNIAVMHARGEYIIQWDDDDLSHPRRMEHQMKALQTRGADACLLQRVTFYWPKIDRVAISRVRLWECSLLIRRESLPAYPPLRRGEDTIVIDTLAGRAPHLLDRGFAICDEPGLHIYLVHGRNTCEVEHFETHWRDATIHLNAAAVDAWKTDMAVDFPIDAVALALQ